MATKTKKKRSGRPPVADEDRRETLVSVFATPGEKEEMRQAADGAGMSLSTWGRTTLLTAARRKPEGGE